MTPKRTNSNAPDLALTSPPVDITGAAGRNASRLVIGNPRAMFWEDRDRHRLTLQMHCHAGHPVRTIAEPLGGNSAGGWTRQLLRILPEVGTVHLVLSPTQSIPRQAFVPILAACFYRRHMIVDWRHRFAELQFESADRLTLGLLRRAARVLVATDSMAASLRRRGVQARSLRPAIDHDRLSKRTLDCVQPHILASLAVEGDGFSSPVGWRCLIQGFQLVKDKYPRAELTVLVDGLTSAQIATSRQQLPAGVALECASDDQIVTECFARADCFVNPAAIGNPVGSVVTALAIGLPVLSTNSGSIPEIISDGVNGLLFRSDQPSALADRVIQLVESPELVASLSIGAKKNAAAFAWPAASKSWLHACQPR